MYEKIFYMKKPQNVRLFRILYYYRDPCRGPYPTGVSRNL